MNPKSELDFEKGGGLVTAIAQDHASGEILMVAFMNPESFDRTLATGQVHYWSRSRDALWHKGEQSGNTQELKSLYIDGGGDVVLLKVEQKGGAACHTGRRSCFFRKLDLRNLDSRNRDPRKLDSAGYEVVSEPVFDPKEVYGR